MFGDAIITNSIKNITRLPIKVWKRNSDDSFHFVKM